MSLLPDTASFHEKVQECFVAFRGHGVSLSGKDLELVDLWFETGVPFEVVARGIRKAAEQLLRDSAAGDEGPRSLASCRRAVDAEIRKYLSRAVGTGGGESEHPPLELERHRKLIAALKKLGKDLPQALAVAHRLAERPPPTTFDAANREEHLAVNLLLRGRPWPERQTLLRRARALIPPAMSRGATQESVRFHRTALVRELLQLPLFWALALAFLSS